jgi:FRG domain
VFVHRRPFSGFLLVFGPHDLGCKKPMTGFKETTVSSWTELRDVLEHLSIAGWAFRGQADTNWPLETSLTRYLKTFSHAQDDWLARERKMLLTFQRKAHLLLSRTPEAGQTLEWLALMQHHGAPTRLLDFTWSPYVAAFFALERATRDAAIWAISAGPAVKNLRGFAISDTLNRIFKLDRGHTKTRRRPSKFDDRGMSKSALKRLAQDGRIPPAVMGEPALMNQRMTTQAGTFVIPLMQIDSPIEAFLPPASIFKVNLKTKKVRRPTMDRLYNMNINNATLFPGIDGLARSLAFELEFQWTVDTTVAERLASR